MSVQLIKWIILFFMACISVQEIDQFFIPETPNQIITNLPEVVNSRNDNMLHTLLSLLHFNAGDLIENVSHTNFEKKGVLRLFTHLKYSHLYSPGYSGNFLLSCQLQFTGPEQTDYYIYALHKIVI